MSTAVQTPAPFKIVYLYDQNTSEFIEAYKAQLSPLDDHTAAPVYLCPIHHTDTVPPTAGVDQVTCFVPSDPTDPTKGSWLLKEDYRGQLVYNQTDNTTKEVIAIGAVPQGYALTSAISFQVTAIASAVSALIHQWRDTYRFSDITVSVGGVVHQWQVNKDSIDLITGAIDMVTQTIASCPPTWRTSDNVDVPITITDLKVIAGAAAVQTQAAFSHSWVLKAALSTAVKNQDIAAIKAIMW
jgi:hypothetical protein